MHGKSLKNFIIIFKREIYSLRQVCIFVILIYINIWFPSPLTIQVQFLKSNIVIKYSISNTHDKY